MSDTGPNYGDLPDPPIPDDVDLRSNTWMKLDLSRLQSSDFIHLANNEEFGAAIKLWTESMRQLPAGSLPNNDKIISSLAGYATPSKRWQKVKPMAMHGFTLCSDGRWYHPVLAEMALDAYSNKWQAPASSNPNDKRAKDRERLRRWRAAKKAANLGQVMKAETPETETHIETPNETFQETRYETDETFQEEDKKQIRNRLDNNINVSETLQGNGNAPVSRSVTPITKPSEPTREGTICKKLRDIGVTAAPHMVVVKEICAQHSDEHILSAAEIALEKKGAGVHVGYVAAMLKNPGNSLENLARKQKNKNTDDPPNRSLLPPLAVGQSHVMNL